MHILIAPDSFKDCLSAADVSACLADGIRRVFPLAVIRCLPLSDGGEGFTETMLAAMGGERMAVEVVDPLMRPVKAFYALLPDGTAVMEMALASGLELLAREERNPSITSTYGTGQLMRAAIERGCRKLVIGIGGSATNDGGTGMAQALGCRFLDAQGNELAPGGAHLNKLVQIDDSAVHPLLSQTEIVVACDVDNPLCGGQGASAVYGPQKGASPEMVAVLDANLAHLAKVVKEQLGTDLLQLRGGGAAGGLGAGLVAFCGGHLRPGFEIVKEQSGLEDAVREADIIVTGEGKLDRQTRQGKTPWGLAQLARKEGKPLLAFAGSLGEGYRQLHDEGFTAVFALPNGPASLDECLKNAPGLLADTAEQVFRLIQVKD